MTGHSHDNGNGPGNGSGNAVEELFGGKSGRFNADSFRRDDAAKLDEASAVDGASAEISDGAKAAFQRMSAKAREAFGKMPDVDVERFKTAAKPAPEAAVEPVDPKAHAREQALQLRSSAGVSFDAVRTAEATGIIRGEVGKNTARAWTRAA